MTDKAEVFDPRKYMEMAIDAMKKSIHEPRVDKTSPMVGAVLLMKDGSVETAFRGELRHGDHAEYTLLERKKRSESLDGAILFATLEPCAPGARRHPKLGCAERIVNARIKKVWVGVEDPDPTVDRKGIKYLIENGIEVEMFDADLQEIIWELNAKFIKEAEERAKQIETKKENDVLSIKENIESKSNLNDFSKEDVSWFIEKANLKVEFNTSDFNRIFSQLGLVGVKDGENVPTGLGILLFGKNPQLIYPNSLIKATYKTAGRGEEIINVGGPLIRQADKIQSWYETKIASQIDRSGAQRKTTYDFPLVVFREAIINAIVHRNYDIEGAPIYFEINDQAIIIKSPGEPVEPLKFDQMKNFSAPSLSRNPKIMYVFEQLGLVEQRGLGFKTIKSLPEDFDIPMPIVTYEAPYMVLTFPRSIQASRSVSQNPALNELNQEELAGYEWLRSKGDVSKREYAEHFGIDIKKAQRQLAKMKKNKLIKDNGEKPGSTQLRYLVI